MPLKLNVGISKKTGLPNYGSLGASCSVELELDGSLPQDDLEDFHQRVRRIYVACSQAVRDELARQQQAEARGEASPSTSEETASRPSAANTNDNGSADGNGRRDGQDEGGRNGQPATARQLDYATRLAGQIRGLGSRRLAALAQQLCGKPLAELGSADASGLIDTLKGIKAGQIDLQAALRGVVS